MSVSEKITNLTKSYRLLICFFSFSLSISERISSASFISNSGSPWSFFKTREDIFGLGKNHFFHVYCGPQPQKIFNNLTNSMCLMDSFKIFTFSSYFSGRNVYIFVDSQIICTFLMTRNKWRTILTRKTNQIGRN